MVLDRYEIDRIIDKFARGKSLLPREQRIFNFHKAIQDGNIEVYEVSFTTKESECESKS